MATEQRPLRLRFELRDDASPAPRVSQGGWVKVCAVATGERFWCRVTTVSADGMLTASVDNDLLSSTLACLVARVRREVSMKMSKLKTIPKGGRSPPFGNWIPQAGGSILKWIQLKPTGSYHTHVLC